MNCDIYIKFGGKDTQIVVTSKQVDDFKDKLTDGDFVVTVPSDVPDDMDVSQLVRVLFNEVPNTSIKKLGVRETIGHQVLTKALIDLISTSYPELNIDRFNNTNISFVSNVTIDELKHMYPDEMRILPDTKRDYNMVFIREAYYKGRQLRGRVFNNGREVFIIRSKEDARDFAYTQHRIQEILKLVSPNEIAVEDDRSDLLRRKYKDKLLKIVEAINNDAKFDFIVKRIKEEQNDSPNLRSIVLDFIYHKSDYSFEINGVYSNNVINDFARELNHEKILYEGSESKLASQLRGISYNRELLGKESLYKILKSQFEDKFNLTAKQFASLGKNEMQELLSSYFKGDPILYGVTVESVPESSFNTQVPLSRDDIIKVYKNRRREGDKTSYKVAVTDKLTDDETENQQIIKEAIGTTVLVDGQECQLNFTVSKDKNGKRSIKYYYIASPLNDSDKIKVTYKGKVLDDIYKDANLGWDTMDFIEEINETGVPDPVTNGRFHGYYIYKVKDGYIISKSVINPNLFIISQFNTLQEAKDTVLSINNYQKPSKATYIDLIKAESLNTDGLLPSITLPINVSNRQTIESLDIKLQDPNLVEKTLKSYERESTLFYSSTRGQVINYYSNKFGLDKDELFQILDTPDKVGMFILKLIDSGITSATATLSYDEEQQVLLDALNDVEDVNPELLQEAKNILVRRYTIKQILDTIKNAKYKQYLVRRAYNVSTADTKRYRVYLQSLTDSNIKVDYKGRAIIGDKTQGIDTCITSGMYHLQKFLNDTLFAGTDISVKITSTEELTNGKLGDTPWKTILGEGDKSLIKGFVYNNTIYINQSHLNSVYDTMYHELFHIALGAIRASDPDKYAAIIEYYSEVMEGLATKSTVDLKDRLTYLKKQVDANYAHLAYQDKIEEIIVNYFAEQMETSSSTYRIADPTDDSIKQELLTLFNKIERNIAPILKTKAVEHTDLGFITSAAQSKQSEMIKQQQITALIEKGISTKEILQHCES